MTRLPARRWTLAVLGILGSLVPRPSPGHQVEPTTIRLRPGGRDFIYVADLFLCAADITATVDDSSKVKVFALNMADGNSLIGDGKSVTVQDRIDQVFIVFGRPGPTGETALSATVTVCWVGVDWPSPTGCSENNCPSGFQIPVTVNQWMMTKYASPGAALIRDPVSTGTGELIVPARTLLRPAGPAGLESSIYYASRLVKEGFTGSLGPNWRHNFEWRLDLTGHNVEITHPEGRVIRFEKGFFDTDWSLAVFTDIPYQLVQTASTYLLADPQDGRIHTFDATTRRLLRIEDGHGNQINLTYASGRLSQAADGLGRTLAYAYDGLGRLVSVSDGTRSAGFGYDAQGRLATVTDPDGGITTHAYDPAQPAAALLVSSTLPRGNVPYVQTYDASGRVISQTDAFGNTFTLAYDVATGRTTVTDPSGNVLVHTYEVLGSLLQIQDPLGRISTLSYDPDRRRSGILDAAGGASAWTFDPASGYLTSFSDADGMVTTYTYAPRTSGGFTFHDLTGVTLPGGAAESYTHDAQGNMISRTDPSGNTWTYTYNGRGQVLTAANPEGGLTTYAYNPDGTTASMTSPSGLVTVYGYDALRRLNSITFPDGTVLAGTYDVMDRIVSMTDEAGNIWTFGYDMNGNETARTTPLGSTWTLGYDALDRVTSLTDPLGNAAAATYDAWDRPGTLTDPTGHSLTFGYDADGRQTSITDQAGQVWSHEMEAEGFSIRLTNPLGASMVLVPDLMGMVRQARTPLGAQVDFDHDPVGRLITVIDPFRGETAFTRDAAGRVTRVMTPLTPVEALYSLNGLGLVTGVTDPRGHLWERVYDVEGRRTADEDPLGNVRTRAYGGRGLISQVTLPGGLGTVDFTHDGRMLLTRRQYSDGADQVFTYDADARLTSAEGVTLEYNAADFLTACNGLTMTRDAAGRLAAITLAPGKTITYAYDPRGLTASVTDWLGGVVTFGYDAAGRPTSIDRPNGVATTRTFDDDDRITMIEESGFSSAAPAGGPDRERSRPAARGAGVSRISLTRDIGGRIVQAMRDVPLTAAPESGAEAYTFDAAGRIESYAYDALGRLTAGGGRTYVWDLASRLDSYDSGPGPVTFTHDVAGHVLSRTEAGPTREYVWNHAFTLPSIAVVRVAGADVRYYVHDPDGFLLYSIEAGSGARRFYHFDEMGNTLFLTDDAGTITDSYAYAPYGRVLARAGTSDNPFTFHGRYGVLEEGGLYLMRARVYDPLTGRFLSRDPVESIDPLTINPYQAFLGDPLAYLDPRGTSAVVAEDRSGPEVRRTLRDAWQGRAYFEADSRFQEALKGTEGQAPDARMDAVRPTLNDLQKLEEERLKERVRKLRETRQDVAEPRDCALIVRKFRSLVYGPARARAILDPEGVRRDQADRERRHLKPLPFYGDPPSQEERDELWLRNMSRY